jgi:hypothetical protein
MKFYNTIIKFRFWLSLLALVAAVGVNYSSGFWPAFILYFVGVIGLASHFFIGPLRLIQEPMEEGIWTKWSVSSTRFGTRIYYTNLFVQLIIPSRAIWP